MTRARIYYARVDEFWRKEEKCAYLDDLQDGGQIEWQELKPDAKHNKHFQFCANDNRNQPMLRKKKQANVSTQKTQQVDD